jgi:hypothetical protein
LHSFGWWLPRTSTASSANPKLKLKHDMESPPKPCPREVWKAYKSDGRIIYVAFLDGRSQMETYKTSDGSPLARADVDVLLKANSGGTAWQRDLSPTGNERWFRFNTAGEEQAVALYDQKSANSPFSVMTPAYRDYTRQRTR